MAQRSLRLLCTWVKAGEFQSSHYSAFSKADSSGGNFSGKEKEEVAAEAEESQRAEGRTKEILAEERSEIVARIRMPGGYAGGLTSIRMPQVRHMKEIFRGGNVNPASGSIPAGTRVRFVRGKKTRGGK